MLARYRLLAGYGKGNIGNVLLPPSPTFGAAVLGGKALRRRDGSLAGPYKVVAVDGVPSAVMLAEPLTITPYIGGAEDRTCYSFGPADLWARMARVLSIKPRGANSVEIAAVAEDARVHVN